MFYLCFPPIVFSLGPHIARMICNRFQIYTIIIYIFFSIIGNIMPKILYFFVNIISLLFVKKCLKFTRKTPISLQGPCLSFLLWNYIDSGASTPTRFRAFFNVIIVAFTKPKRWFVNSGSSGLLTRELL